MLAHMNPTVAQSNLAIFAPNEPARSPREMNKQKTNEKDLLAKTSSINSHDNPITRRKRIPVFKFSHILEPFFQALW